MRLINIEELDVISWTATGQAEYDKGYADGVSMMADRIDSAPAVDAVPMEWLRKVRNDGRLTIDDVETIDLILTWYQKEQGVR